jgi:hypothetical protein
MRRVGCFLFLLLFCTNSTPHNARAQSYAPEMYGVGEIIVNYVRFDDPKIANTCGLTREEIASFIAKSFEGTGVPAIAALDANPPRTDVARIQLIPQISSYADNNMNCISWISLSAESHANVVILPVRAPRSITALYWRQQAKVSSGATLHSQTVNEALKNMIVKFIQQYRVDQPAGPGQK